MKLFKRKKLKNNYGFGMDTMIGFLVLFAIAIIVVLIMSALNKFM